MLELLKHFPPRQHPLPAPGYCNPSRPGENLDAPFATAARKSH